MANEISFFVSLECSLFYEIMLLIFLVTQVIFVCLLVQYFQSSSLCNKINMLFVCGTEVASEQYNVKHYGKHDIVLLDTCYLYLYLPLGWVG